MTLAAIQQYTQSKMSTDVTGHDYYHAQRVAQTALVLYQADMQNSDSQVCLIIQLIAYLHDTIDDKLTADPDQALAEVASLLKNEPLSTDEKANILDSIQHLSFSENLTHHYQLSMEGQYVQDGDRLDALGAIGIARTFAYGGAHGQKIYDPNLQPINLQNKASYRQHQSTTINHFDEKLLHLVDTMNTRAGRQEAQRRTDYMCVFLEEFWAEVE